MEMIRSCNCIKDLKVSAMKYLGNGKHSKPYMLTIFKEGEKYVWKKYDGDIYISDTYKHLRNHDYYNADVEYMDESEFNDYFIKNDEKIIRER